MNKSLNRDGNIESGAVAELVSGTLYGPSGLVIDNLITDSRSSRVTGRTLFFAISGVNHDGHNFIPNLYSRGVRAFVVSEYSSAYSSFADAAFIVTDDPVAALQGLAAFRRSLFNGRVVAVTGSAGKTIVKEWLSSVVSTSARVVRSPRSYNSQTGVPLSVWQLDKHYDVAVIEAGISRRGEMERLAPIVRPNIGIFTNIGDAHQEGFSSMEEKVFEKMKLFGGVDAIIYPYDSALVREGVSRFFTGSGIRDASWSLAGGDASFRVDVTSSDDTGTVISIRWNHGVLGYKIPFSDRASVENSIHVAVASVVTGIESNVIREAMSSLVPVAMRMSVRNGINDCLLIEDYYNSDPGSLAMALDYLKTRQGRSHTLILSDFLQTGRPASELARDVARLISGIGIDRFIGIGEGLCANASLFDGNSSFYRTTEEFTASFRSSGFSDEVILLKGARSFRFEKIVALLEKRRHDTVLEVNLDAIVSNLNSIRGRLNTGVGVMAMVKAFAYGSGYAETGSLFEYNRVDYLGVAYCDEGVELRNAGITTPVMVMNPDISSFETIIRYNLEPEIYSFRVLDEFLTVAASYGVTSYPVHIKIDTGMHRLGFLPADIERLVSELSRSDLIRVASLFSHLAASDDTDFDSFTRRQADLFISCCERFAELAGYMPLRHLLNSSGVVNYPQFQFDMVRPGIALYGLARIGDISLRQALRYTSLISQVKEVPAGEPVGYGCRGAVDYPRRVATIPAGYADGIRREMGNGKGFMWTGGVRVPTIGNICMDMCMLDITGTQACEGDSVEIFGDNITVAEVASVCGTIPYDVVTSIPPRVRRVLYRE